MFQKVFCRAVVGCGHCGERVFVPRATLGAFRRYCQCPQCGTRDLSKLRSGDHVEKMNRNPLRMLLGLFGAPLYHCTFCRLQFRDWRKRAPEIVRMKGRGGGGGAGDSGNAASLLNLCA